jgi:hypothetical protein
MEIKQDYIYKHNEAYLKCKNNHGGDGPVNFFIPLNLAPGPAGVVEFEPNNYTISQSSIRKSLRSWESGNNWDDNTPLFGRR